MRFSRRHRARNNGDESILPLTNVVFLLLIFFMLAGRITGPQPFEVDPPRSASEAAADASAIEVQLSSTGALALDGKPVELDALTDVVRGELDAHPDWPLRLKADGGGDATRVVAVMHALRDAGATKLRLITLTTDSE
ncbi:ExbD/TolR family protein [Salinisphaera aquimarina]|uniref:ExbD/TolR family protein n=1 Tax=Salinisphaera aquimarina TaxID=2094031 RepID=A0ABV7EPW9_9GAMM